MDSVEVHLRPCQTLGGNSSGGYPASVFQEDETSQIPNTLRFDVYRDQLRLATAPIREELRLVEQMLFKELQASQSNISEMLSYVADLGGKRLRPCLLLLSAKAAGLASEGLASDFTKNFAKSLILDAVRFLDDSPASPSVAALRQLAMAAVDRKG